MAPLLYSEQSVSTKAGKEPALCGKLEGGHVLNVAHGQKKKGLSVLVELR